MTGFIWRQTSPFGSFEASRMTYFSAEGRWNVLFDCFLHGRGVSGELSTSRNGVLCRREFMLHRVSVRSSHTPHVTDRGSTILQGRQELVGE